MHLTQRPKEVSLTDFRRNLRVLEREVVRQLEGETDCCGVTLPQCHTLLELSFAERSLGSLAEGLGLDPSTLSRTVEGLVKAGLVERTEDPADRRSVRLTLSGAGRSKVEQIDGMCNRYYANLLGGLSAKDRSSVVRAIGLLAELMRSARTAPACCSKEAPDGRV